MDTGARGRGPRRGRRGRLTDTVKPMTTAAPTAAQIEAELAEAEAEVGIEPTLADDTETDEAAAEETTETAEDSQA